MPRPSEHDLLVLHGLRIKGLAEPDGLAAATGFPVEGVGHVLEVLERDGLVRRRDGKVSGWSLTAPGRDEHDRLVHEELDGAGLRVAVRDAYDRFLALNHGFLGLCSEWQTGDAAGALDRLPDVHAEVRPIVDELAARLERFATYGPRLDHALEQLLAGDGDWFTKPLLDSYHTVWSELHEDLLSTLGIQRGSEVTL